MASAEQKAFARPDETRTFEYGQVDLIDIGGGQVGRLTLQPGWRWSEHVKPIANTESYSRSDADSNTADVHRS